MLAIFIRQVLKHRFWVLLIIAIITLFFGSQIKNLKIVIDPNTMLPQDHPNVVGTRIAETLFGSKHVVVLGVSSRDGSSALQAPVLNAVVELSKKLAQVNGVKAHTLMSVSADKAKAISGSNLEMRVEPLLPMPITPNGIAQLKQNIANNPVYQDVLLSKDERVTSISFAIQSGKTGFRSVMDGVQTVLDQTMQAHPDVVIRASGSPVFFAAVERFAQRMAFLFPIALLLIGIIHFEAFRTFQGLILPLVTALLAVVWGLGIMGAAKVPMDAFNATTPILILAVAAGHAVQILKRYYEEYDAQTLAATSASASIANHQAIVQSLQKVAPVMLTAGLVAALGFFSLITFDIATIRTFGVFTGLGILSALLIELTFIPALRSYLPAPKPSRAQHTQKIDRSTRFWQGFTHVLTQAVLVHRKKILWGFLALGLLSSVGIFFINQENSTKSYFGKNLPVRQDDRFLNQALAGTNTLYVVFQGKNADKMKEPAVLKLMESTQNFIQTLPDVGKTTSIVDFIKQMHRAMNDGQAAFYQLPDSQDVISQYLLLYSMSGQANDFEPYIDYEYLHANLTVWMKNDSSKYAAHMVKSINDYVQPRLPNGVSISIGGSVPQSSALSETLVRGKILNIAQMMAVVFIAGVVIFRSIAAGIYLILPLLLTVLVNFGMMSLTGIPLNTPNSVASAMAIGIGADYAIYLLYRMREEWQRLGDFDAALTQTLGTAGKAVMYVASAISGGYAVLMLSFNFYVHIWFGILIVLSMVVSACSALLLVPALLKTWPPKFLRDTLQGTPSMHVVNAVRKKTLPHSNMLSGFMVIFVALASILLIFQPMQQVQAQTQDAAPNVTDLMERSYQATRFKQSVSDATFRLISASGQERVRKTFAATKMQDNGQDNRRVIRFLSPSDVRNTSTLMIENQAGEDEIWVYLPALKKSRRIAGQNKKGSFVGTELSYGDIIGHKPSSWAHKFIRQDKYEDAAVYVIESIPKSSDIANQSGYSKRLQWLDKNSAIALKTEFYDLGGALLKTSINSDLKLVDAKNKKWQTMTVQVKNHQTGGSTIVKLDKFDIATPVSDDYFATRYLEKEE